MFNPAHRRAALFFGLFACALLAAFVAEARLPSPRAIDAQILRVATWNIHHGEGTDGAIDLTRIAALLQAERIDACALQEVDRGVERTARRDLPGELAALTGWTSVFFRNIDYQGGEYGNAVLTRLPTARATNLHYRMLRPHEQRGLMQVELHVGTRRILLLNTHIDYRPDDSERLVNMDEALALASRWEGPVVFAGDFNAEPGSRTYAKVAAAFTDVWTAAGAGDGLTYPSDHPRKRIDYLFVRGAGILTPVRAWVPRGATPGASDHLPVVAELSVKP